MLRLLAVLAHVHGLLLHQSLLLRLPLLGVHLYLVLNYSKYFSDESGEINHDHHGVGGRCRRLISRTNGELSAASVNGMLQRVRLWPWQ